MGKGYAPPLLRSELHKSWDAFKRLETALSLSWSREQRGESRSRRTCHGCILKYIYEKFPSFLHLLKVISHLNALLGEDGVRHYQSFARVREAMLLENEGISKLLPLRLLLLCKAITTELITQKIERSVQRDRKPTFFTPMHISNSSIFKKKGEVSRRLG